jgi:hypothetical protein
MRLNDSIGDGFIRHAIDLEKFKAGERNKALRFLKSLEDDLVAALAGKAGTAWSKARLQALLSEVRATISTAYAKLRLGLDNDLSKLAQVEMETAAAILNSKIGVDIVTVGFDSKLLKSIVSDALIEGGPQAEWWSRQQARTLQVFADTVRKGIASGTTTDDLVGTLRGNLFSGMLGRNVDALVRTSVASVAADARAQLYEDNDDIVQFIQQRSTLDARSTPICMAYSGLMWSVPDYKPVGHDLPYNNGCPRHWGCRSTDVPVLSEFSKLGGGTKSDERRAQRIFEQKLDEQGLGDKQIAAAMRDAQASMDGYVSEDLTYEDWLDSKPAAFQKEVLGPGKWKLWQDGAITFTDLVDQSGSPLSVEQLRKLAS